VRKVFLAPVAGYTDRPFRSVCVDWGADLCYTEMVSAEALVRSSAKTEELLLRADNEREYAIQLFGSSPAAMAQAAKLVAACNPVCIDVNAGCPVPKVVKNGAGSALMRSPQRIREIIQAMRAETDIPVTVKFRSGWDADTVNFMDFAEQAILGGASALCLHARTRAQGYSGRADWAHLARLKKNSPVPVYGSGDIFTPEDALRMEAETGVDAVMIARGAMGNPFIFREIKMKQADEPAWRPSLGDRLDTMRRHLALSVPVYGERLACIQFRKQFCAYTKGIFHGAEVRKDGAQAESRAEYESLFARLLAMAENPGAPT
jgi:tRNA-dihydrouridine synthase B